MPVGDAFIQGTEIWIPDGQVLRHHAGAYRGNSEFARVSAVKTFRRGEGLPGAVWSTRRPEVWNELGAHFVRAELAAASGIEAAVGFPIFRGDEVAAVVVLLCGQRSKAAGCVEVWDANHELNLLDHAGGYYGRLERFGAMSRLLQFQPGAGLPGVAWQTNEPQLVEDEGKSPMFVRGSIAREYGIASGIAIPIQRSGRVEHVLVLLSTEATPIAKAFEVWGPVDGALKLLRGTYSADLDAFADLTRGLSIPFGEGLPGLAYQSQLPVLLDQLDSPRFVRDEAARAAGLEVGIAIPVYAGDEVKAVACLLS